MILFSDFPSVLSAFVIVVVRRIFMKIYNQGAVTKLADIWTAKRRLCHCSNTDQSNVTPVNHK